MNDPPALASLPSRDLLQAQSAWLAPARARLLRKAGIAHRRRVLELGCGYGVVTEELSRRCAGEVVAMDRVLPVLPRLVGASRVCGDALRLPFRSASFGVVFTQNVLLWTSSLRSVVNEVHRVLAEGGVAVCLEPDYGGMMESPTEFASKDIWIAALRRAGADPLVGRQLPEILRHTGLQVQVELLNTLRPPDSRRWNLLKELPLTDTEIQTVRVCERQSMSVVHLPYFLILAEKLPEV